MKTYSTVIQLLCSLCFVCGMISCGQPSENNEHSELINIKLHPNDLPPLSKLSDVVESVRIIPLETRNDIIIGNIRRAFVGNDHMVFASYSGEVDMHLFSMEGKFIRKIGQYGKGPGEYTTVFNLSVFEEEQLIFVTDNPGRPSIKYSFNGKSEPSVDPPARTWNMIFLDPHTYAAAGFSDYEVRIIDTKLSDTLKFLPLLSENSPADPVFTGSRYDEIFYSAKGSDSVYSVSKDGVEIALGFDFGSGHMTIKEARQPAMRQPANKISIIYGALHCGEFYQTTLEVTQNKKPPLIYSLFINQTNQQCYLMDVEDNSDDVLFCTSFYFPAVSQDEEIVTVVDAIDLIEALPQIEKNQNFKYSKKLIEQIKSLQENDNPVIVLFKLK